MIMNNMGNIDRMYFTVRDSFGDDIGEARYASFDAAKEALKNYCERTDTDVDGAWLGIVYKGEGEGQDIKCALVQNHVTPNYDRFRSMYSNLSERALSVPEIELAALWARQMEFPFDRDTQERIDVLEKQLGVYERETSTVGDLYVGKWRVHIVPPGGRYGYENRLVNKDRESSIEFWDMSVKKSSFPDGQFVTRYDLDSLYDTKWGAGADLMMRGGLCLDGANAAVWSLSGPEMTQVFHWLKNRELLPAENFLYVSGEVDVPYDVVDHIPLPHMDSAYLASEVALNQRLNGLAFVRDLHVERMGEYKEGTGYTFSFTAQAERGQVEKDMAQALEGLPHEVDIENKSVAVKKESLDKVINGCAAQVKNDPAGNEKGMDLEK